MKNFPRTTVATSAAAAFACLFLLAATSHAAVGDLYAATGAGGGAGFCSGGTLSSLYTIDPATGAASLVGPIEVNDVQVRHVTALAFHPSTGVLYGVMNGQVVGDDCNDSTLLTIDPATGAATIIGTEGSIFGPIPDIAFDPFGTLYGWTEGGDELVVIDVTTGTASQVESTDFETSQTGLASDSDGRLYVKSGNFLTRINQYTAQIFDGDFLNRGASDMLAFDQNDVLFSAERISGGLTLFTIDLEFFTTTEIGSNSIPNISALAFDRGVVTPPNVSDLSISKEADDSSPEQGTNIVFTLTLTNDGPDAADNVVVHDQLPTSFTFVSASGDGTYDENSGEWSVGSVAASSSATIDITATATYSGDYINSAEVVASDSYDPDSVVGSGDLSSDIHAEVSDTVLRATLFSIDAFDPYLWVTDPMLEVLSYDLAQEITLDGFGVCGGNGLAKQPTTGTLFGVLAVDDCSTRRLVTLDPVTAEATDVGSFGSVRIAAITFGGDQDTLYATSGNAGSQQRTLFSVDPTNATLTAECVLAPGNDGRALAWHDGLIYDATSVCDPTCVVVTRIIDPANFPSDPTETCPGTSVQSVLEREPTGLTFKRSGADFVEFYLSTFNEIYDLNLPDVGTAQTVFRQYLSHYSKGLAEVTADVTIGNLETSKSATKNRVKGDKLITYTLAATNSGPDSITNVELSDPLPVGTSLVSLGSGCSETGGVVTCDAGFLDANSTEYYSFTVQATCKKCSSVSNTVTIQTSSDIYDYPFDNSSGITTSIKGKF